MVVPARVVRYPEGILALPSKSHGWNARPCVALAGVAVGAAALVVACASAPPRAGPSDDGGTDARGADAGAACTLSTQQKPRQAPSYYVDQGYKYFDAIDTTAPEESVPTYSPLVARWEWPPWLKLTGYTKPMMADSDRLLKTLAPAKVAPRDCRFFPVQPFARCRVAFTYTNQGGGKPCAIYEEFTFNDQGEMTFIEAWSDLPGLLPSGPSDPWAEGSGVHRLSTRVPGLGTPTGRIDPAGACMKQAATEDAEIADFVTRALDFWPTWGAENSKAGSDYFARGCGW